MAFETLHRPLFTEHGSVHFANSHTPLKTDNYAFCQVRTKLMTVLNKCGCYVLL